MIQRIYDAVFLNQGEMIVLEKPGMVYTVLGSCVSVTFYHAGTGVGGIIHAMYPGYHFRHNIGRLFLLIQLFEKWRMNFSAVEYLLRK